MDDEVQQQVLYEEYDAASSSPIFIHEMQSIGTKLGSGPKLLLLLLLLLLEGLGVGCA